jgi:hypothetical protein
MDNCDYVTHKITLQCIMDGFDSDLRRELTEERVRLLHSQALFHHAFLARTSL